VKRRPERTIEHDRRVPRDGGSRRIGVPPNELTGSAERDFLAGTPRHKHVPARVERIA
jgi:formate dehydrogenase